jgi:hypothetical protein
VLSALSTTTASGNFAFAYSLTETAPAAPAALASPSSTTTTPCPTPVYNGTATFQTNTAHIGTVPTDVGVATTDTAPPASESSPPPIPHNCVVPARQPQDVSVSGQGTIDVSPMAMAASADVSNFGTLAIRVDGTDVWELSAGDDRPTPNPGDNGPGQDLSSFAGLVEGTLGQREGAVAMLGMASPSGFLDLSQQAVTGAAQVGLGVVDGTAVTEYDVSIDLAQLAQVSGITPEEATTIGDAVSLLNQLGYTQTTVKVGIDGAGFIREVTPVARFSDGATVTLDATFSDFGCAGTVLMPGQSGSSTPAPGCVSPDSPTATSTTTTSS